MVEQPWYFSTRDEVASCQRLALLFEVCLPPCFLDPIDFTRLGAAPGDPVHALLRLDSRQREREREKEGGREGERGRERERRMWRKGMYGGWRMADGRWEAAEGLGGGEAR